MARLMLSRLWKFSGVQDDDDDNACGPAAAVAAVAAGDRDDDVTAVAGCDCEAVAETGTLELRDVATSSRSVSVETYDGGGLEAFD